MKLDRQQIAALLPHGNSMCLLNTVVHCDADSIHCRSSTHTATDNVLRLQGELSSMALLEYAAQAMAVHVGMTADDKTAEQHKGVLASVRDVRLLRNSVSADSQSLSIRAQRLQWQPTGFTYEFSISDTTQSLMTQALMTGQATIVVGRQATVTTHAINNNHQHSQEQP